MLRGVPDCISPELLKVLHEMGHGDTIVIADANFPAASIASEGRHRELRCDGHRAVPLLDAILQVFPLDTFVEHPVIVMDKMEMHKDLACPIWEEFRSTIETYDPCAARSIQFVERFSFYEAAKEAYAVVSTGEKALYACLILRKGCL